jgi:long-subunit fatty acid transport protein
MFKNCFSYGWLLVFLLIGQNIMAQNITSSPYSMLGIGEPVYSGNANFLSMGQIGQGIRQNALINASNSASFGALKQTNIEAGLALSNAEIFTANQKTSNSNAWLSYINFGMPLSTKKEMGISFGLAPFSSIGYQINSVDSVKNDTFMVPISKLFSGNGGLSKVHLGYGMRLYKNVSIGIDYQYIFGQLKHTNQLIIPSQYNMFGLNQDIDVYASGSAINLAAQYNQFFNYFNKSKQVDSIQFVLGLNFRPNASLAADQQLLVRTLPVGFGIGTKDTIVNQVQQKGTLVLPSMFQVGFSLGKAEKWVLASDIRFTDWTQYRLFDAKDSLQNAFGFSIGYAVCPDPYQYKNIFKRTTYRVGFRYDQSPVKIANHSLNEIGLSAGLGFSMGRSKSTLNIGVEFIKRGNTGDQQIQENYFKLVLGINFADRWFNRYRYD